MLINKVFIEISNFELIPSEKINEEIFYFPEEDPYNRNFQECGIESRHSLQNMGFPLYIMLGYVTFVVIYFILAAINCVFRSKYLGKLVTKINSYLFWNGFIRLFMELYQGLAVATVLNIHTSEGD